MNSADAAIERKSGEGQLAATDSVAANSSKKRSSGKSAKSEEGQFALPTIGTAKSDKKEEQP